MTGSATGSAFTEKTFRLWGSLLTACQLFTALCFDLSLLKPDFFYHNFSSVSAISFPLNLPKYFFPMKAHSGKVKYLFLYSVSDNLFL